MLDLVYALKRPYRKNASFIMNDKTLAQLRKLKDNNGAYIWQPSYQSGEPDKVLGYAVHTSAYAPENAIAFGDYSYYNIGDRGTRSFKQLTELFAGNGTVIARTRHWKQHWKLCLMSTAFFITKQRSGLRARSSMKSSTHLKWRFNQHG